MNLKLISSVESTVLKYLPSSHEMAKNDRRYAFGYASFILSAWRSGHRWFGRRQKVNYDKIIRHLRAALDEYNKFPLDSFVATHPILGIDFVQPEEGKGLVMRFKPSMQLEAMISAYEDLSVIPQQRTAANKRNWRAAAIAGICREVWAKENRRMATKNWREHVRSNSGSTEVSESELVYTFAPISQHHDRPSSFGNFIEDVLLVLGAVDVDGKPMSAASALRSLQGA